MLAIIPVTTDTVELLPSLSKVIRHLGPNDLHNLLVISTAEHAADAQLFCEEVSRMFSSAEVEVLPASGSSALPPDAERNALFRRAAVMAEASNPQEPWVWLEHATPTQSGWLSAMQEEYNGKGTRFVGDRSLTFFRAVDKAGNVIMEPKPLFDAKGDHMRVGMYPGNFASHSILLKFLKNDPFELYLQHETEISFKESRRVQTIWASANFRRDSQGAVTGDQTYETEIRTVEPVDIDAVVLLQGCRDESMNDLICSEPPRSAYDRGTSSGATSVDDVQPGMADLRAQLTQSSAQLASVEAANQQMRSQLDQAAETIKAQADALDQAAKGDLKDVNAAREEVAELKSKLASIRGKLAYAQQFLPKKTDKKKVKTAPEPTAGVAS